MWKYFFNNMRLRKSQEGYVPEGLGSFYASLFLFI